MSSIPWGAMIVDEAHRLKNSESLLYRTLADVRCLNIRICSSYLHKHVLVIHVYKLTILRLKQGLWGMHCQVSSRKYLQPDKNAQTVTVNLVHKNVECLKSGLFFSNYICVLQLCIHVNNRTDNLVQFFNNG